MKNLRKFPQHAIIALSLIFTANTAFAQYFGQNKPRYQSFDFEILQTPHFDIYHYVDNEDFIKGLAKQTEQWYHAHQSVLEDTFYSKNPVLFYNNHADFQQTNAIFGSIGVGTGGVTEGFKNRVILPYTMTNQQTHHVLGHELVHAFQYHLILRGDSASTQSLENLPLWMVEGLAEYMSIGRVDPHTAMWMRDAVLHDDVPSLKDLNNPEYFPYRYGQAFWAFITGLYGDEIIKPLFMQTARLGLEGAIVSLFPGFTMESLSDAWVNAQKTYYKPFLGDMEENYIGRKIISKENAGEMNISPSLSPNGRYVIFLSEKNLFSTDLYIADARSGKNVRRITRILKNNHLDDISFLESSGTWSPDSKRFAFVGFKEGKNIITIKNPENGKTLQNIEVPGVPAISNPVWSPDGDVLVFSGLVEGQTDLFSYSLKTEKVTQLTNNIYAEIQPNFNSEGTQITFATDQLSMENPENTGNWTLNIAVMDFPVGEVRNLTLFQGAENLNPQFDHQGNILFLSDRDGFRNLYRFEPELDKVYKMTNFLTGISGITKYSPAITVNTDRDRVIFSMYDDDNYNIYQADREDFLEEEIEPYNLDRRAGTLPIVGVDVNREVSQNLDNFESLPSENTSEYAKQPYDPRFGLLTVAGGVGVGVGNGTFGTQTAGAGGIGILFSDILGNNILYGSLNLNGDILDFGGAVQYLNQKHRFAYGVAISHLPIRTGFVNYATDTISYVGENLPVLREDVNILRIFDDNISLIGQYVFNRHLRLEGNAGVNYRYFRWDRYPNFYEAVTGFYRYLGQGEREKVPIPADEIQVGGYQIKKGIFYTTNAALVGDNSSFGLTAPLNGYRFRLDATKYYGTYNMFSNNIDLRGYQWLKPVSLALRFQHFARHGADAESFSPILIGWQGLVHGYDYNQIIKQLNLDSDAPNDNVTFNSQLSKAFSQLSGSKLFLSSFEVRMPFTGPERLALIKSGFLLTDLNVFFDAGVAFDEYSHFKDGEEIRIQQVREDGTLEDVDIFVKPKLALSTGVSLRVNLFGALILEPYLAVPLTLGESRPLLGLNFLPGW